VSEILEGWSQESDSSPLTLQPCMMRVSKEFIINFLIGNLGFT